MIGPFLFCKTMAPRFLERRYGRIVNVASIAGKEGNPTLMPYSASKAAVIAMTKSLAKELAGKGDITVNAISPAVIRTAILDRIAPATVDYMISKSQWAGPGQSTRSPPWFITSLARTQASRPASAMISVAAGLPIN